MNRDNKLAQFIINSGSYCKKEKLNSRKILLIN